MAPLSGSRGSFSQAKNSVLVLLAVFTLLFLTLTYSRNESAIESLSSVPLSQPPQQFFSSTLSSSSSTESNSPASCEDDMSVMSSGVFTGCLICAARTRHPLKRSSSLSAVGSISSTAITSSADRYGNKEAFDKIYLRGVWSEAGGGSGVGSDPEYARVAGHVLRLVVLKYGVTSVLDAPCGGVSLSWTKTAIEKIREDIPCFRYHGVDVVSTVVERNRAAFVGQRSSWTTFSVHDLSLRETQLPAGFGLILSRDALQHLSYDAITGALDKYCSSDAYYLLVGSYLEEVNNDNKNIKSGDCFKINLLRPPFSFPQPVEMFAERGVLSDRLMAANSVIEKDPFPVKYLLLYHLDELCRSEPLQNFIKTFRNQ